MPKYVPANSPACTTRPSANGILSFHSTHFPGPVLDRAIVTGFTNTLSITLSVSTVVRSFNTSLQNPTGFSLYFSDNSRVSSMFAMMRWASFQAFISRFPHFTELGLLLVLRQNDHR